MTGQSRNAIAQDRRGTDIRSLRLHLLAAGVVAAAVATAAPHAHAAPSQTTPRAASQVDATTHTVVHGLTGGDRNFLRNAAQGGHAEVIAGKLAVTNASAPAVRDYGQRLMDDHMAADRKLDELAGRFGITLPSRPGPDQQGELDRLKDMTGPDFDREFTQKLGIEAHRQTIALFRKEADAASANAAVRRFAQNTLPTLEQHLRIAENLQANGGAASARVASGNGAAAGAGAIDTSTPAGDAQQEVREAVQVVHKIKSDPHAAQLLQQARGVLILPNYGRAALGVGVQGGEGVLVTRNGKGGFGDPAFYNMGGIGIGAQAGASGGEVAFLLMSDRAVQKFRSGQKFSLNADAGLTIVDYSRRGEQSTGKLQDVVVWSDTRGVYAGASVAITDVMVDRKANHAYYRKPDVTASAILGGRVDNPHNNVLGMVLGV